ncbi:MBL fold metallo-hydrolase [Lacibacter sp.]|uniref:MBL fold metallo-hydrolase n=1 Tax=Lacibacter sp. TaxID=1915409 RepID=UPI002B4AC8CE|nr:MBL fold metallo-hydrolase [Lacibacter sp.]HLP39450.1 MBL fold metallo-hydrolase [Lacibacter sp.]
MKVLRKAVLLFLKILNTLTLLGKEAKEIFVITKMTEHVYIAHPSRVSRINSTTTIIVNATYLSVIESQTDLFMAKELIAAIRKKISALPIRYLIFSHYHTDHILGAQAFLQENPSLIIIAQQQAARHIFLYAEDEKISWSETVWQQSVAARDSALSSISEERKNYFSGLSDELGAYSKDIRSSAIILPNLTFYDSLILHDKNADLQLYFLGDGHTQGDIIAMIPQDKVLVTGDLVHDYEPLFWNAHPDSWIEVLEKINVLDFEYFVGGHGDIHIGKDIIHSWLNYMKELKVKTIAAINKGLTLEAFLHEVNPDTFISLQNGYADRIQKFRLSYMNYFTGSLQDAIKAEITDLWKFYEHHLKKD